MTPEQTTAAALAALRRVHEGLHRAYDDEYEPYTDADRAYDEWADSHPEAQA